MKALLRAIMLILFRVKFENLEKLNLQGRVIIMPNHLSFLDGFFLYLFLPKETVYIIKTRHAKTFAPIMRFVNHIAINPLNPYSIRKIINSVKDNVPLVLFPEGRITTNRGLMKIYDGAGFVALKTGATIYPVIINGLEYSKAARVKDKVKTSWFPQTHFYVDDPVQLALQKGKRMRVQKREASERILKVMQQALFRSRYKENINLFNELTVAAKLHGWNKKIIEDVKQTVTYKSLVLGSYILARKFRSFLGSGEDNAGVLLPNSIAHVTTLFGLFYLNRTPAILNFSAGMQNVADCVDTAGIKTLFTSREFIEKGGYSRLVEYLGQKCRIVYLEDVKNTIGLADKMAGLLSLITGQKPRTDMPSQLILFTSGSEAKPKGVVLSHSSIRNNITQISCVVDFHGKDKIFNALPMFHSSGLTPGTLLPILSGTPLFLYPSPLHYKLVPEVSYEKNATILFGTNTFLAGYGKNAHPFDFYSIRYIFAGAEKIKDDVRALWQDKFGLRIFDVYGCTETAPVLTMNTPLSYRKGSVGRALPGIEFKIEDVEGITRGGNLKVKGPNVMEGYLIHGKGFVPAEEWYDTGDIVSLDKDGYVTIESRLKRFAKISGEMVSLNLVEELSGQCFGCPQAFAAINLPDHKKGEKVVLITSDKSASLKALREYLMRHRYSMLMSPAEIIYIDKLPILGSGKIDYVWLTDNAQQDMANTA